MANYLTICYEPCESAPLNGYKIMYRPSGSAEAFRTWPTNFFPSTPELLARRAAANLLITEDADGTQYEGFGFGDCPAGLGVASPWTTGDNPPESDSGGGSASASGGGGLGHGTIFVQECATEGMITEVRWNGFVVLNESGSFPVNPGETAIVGVPAPGSHTLAVTGDFPIGFSVSVQDSLGNVSCQDGAGFGTLTFPAFIIAGSFWTVTLSCGPC